MIAAQDGALLGRPSEQNRPVGSNLLPAGVVALFLVSLVIVGVVAIIETQYRPQGSLLGRPTRIPACGRSYLGPGRTFTRAEVDADITPGYRPAILEPVIGEVPLGGTVSKLTLESGDQVCDTLIFLQVGPDAFASYALEGGP